MKINKIHAVSRLALICWLIIQTSTGQHLFAQATDFQLVLDNVHVLQQRESGGDRPYFCSVVFRSRIFQRGSTEVTIVESEPHDWVSKAKYNEGRLSRGDHMTNNEALNIPSWMGKLEWQNVNLVPFSRANAVGAEIFGALVISLDNNNTPPHVVRNLLEKLKTLTENVLRTEVERGSILGGDLGATQDRIKDMAKDLISAGEAIELFFQMTVGSTFNPDRITGINAYIFPAFTELGMSADTSVQITDRNIGPITAKIELKSPLAFSNGPDIYEGSGARYRVNTRLVRNASAAPINVSELILEIRTGGDDLRGGNDNLNVSVLFERDRPHTVNNVNKGARWRDNSTQTVRIRLPRPMPLSEISGLTLNTTFGGGTGGDNWNMDAIKVRAVGTGIDRIVHDRSGRPLNRFTGDRQSFRISF